MGIQTPTNLYTPYSYGGVLDPIALLGWGVPNLQGIPQTYTPHPTPTTGSGDKVKASLDMYKLPDLLTCYTQYAILTLSYRYCVNFLQLLSDRSFSVIR
ncbi:hypothetical protein H6G81_22730 [Scytonema hofmannii FACHB-248]|uniref:Uncharacterized protein n=1 Tax=Scytonema hofmannii FACHB-248 TaxID=1842502 RepID=A0ABR8GW19_9CYAN|nr:MULTISPECIES: hypothetical protein [Nostocales]MBD2607265.1 hypothetical protein [Scytonema hofmannii FACHB-248]